MSFFGDSFSCLLPAQGLDVLAPALKAGNFARPRIFEIAAAVNRLRSVRMEQR